MKIKLVLLILLSWVSLHSLAYACSCAEYPTSSRASIEKAFNETPIVFSGKVIKVDHVKFDNSKLEKFSLDEKKDSTKIMLSEWY